MGVDGDQRNKSLICVNKQVHTFQEGCYLPPSPLSSGAVRQLWTKPVTKGAPWYHHGKQSSICPSSTAKNFLLLGEDHPTELFFFVWLYPLNGITLVGGLTVGLLSHFANPQPPTSCTPPSSSVLEGVLSGSELYPYPASLMNVSKTPTQKCVIFLVLITILIIH